MQSRSLVLCVFVSCVASEGTSKNDDTKDINDKLIEHSTPKYDDFTTTPHPEVYVVGEKCVRDTGTDVQPLKFEEPNLTVPTVRLPLTGYRTRQEYRTLSVSQRTRFHKALNELYKDGTYTCFATVHRHGVLRGGTHSGYAFMPWHRVFIALFEDALRLKDPDLSLPYWDSSLDDNMANGPGYSIMWDNEHLGTGVGEVKEGPFAGWGAPRGPLTRNVARGAGAPARQDRINDLLTRCSFDDFSEPFEGIHNAIHKWVGGTFEGSGAASDPIFYMHHAYIDYIWETFRQRQRTACGVDPASDYPHAKYSEEHAAEHGMYGISSFKNKEGMADFWIKNWYNYTDTPTCANNCSDSPDLYCDKDINLCASQSRVSFGDDGIGTIAPLKAVPQPQVIAAREMTSTPGDATSTVDVDDHIREGV